MKITRIIVLYILLLQSLCGLAQSSLADSKRYSPEVYIYRVSKDDLRNVHLKDDSYDEGMLTSYVTKYNFGVDIPTLPRGNYLLVTIVENRLQYIEHTVDDLYAKIVPSEKFVVCLYDSLGNMINDATVKKGSSKLRYDKATQTYICNKAKEEELIEIDNKGVFHYYEVDDSDYGYKPKQPNFFQSSWWKTKRKVNNVLYPSRRSTTGRYTGFVVFSKPKYKPGETVKLKAYLSETNGNRYNEVVDIKLTGEDYRSNKNIVLAKLKPYRSGMYTYEFKLTDDLDLNLDQNYSISLITNDADANVVSGSFRYEDYELKGINYSLQSDRKEYAIGDSIKLKMKVTDENDMAAYDGKIEVLITPAGFNLNKMKRMEPVFVVDTLWSHTVDMSGLSEKELIVPNSIFPAGVNLNFAVKCTYLSADNEKHEDRLVLTRLDTKYSLDFSLKNGMLTIKQLYKGQSEPASAKIQFSGENDECILQDSVQLPYTIAVPWNADDLTVITKQVKNYYGFDSQNKEQIGYKFYRTNDSIYLDVDNPANIPFWYTVRKMQSDIARGYTTQLSYAIKDSGEDGYSMQLVYLFGGEAKKIDASLPFAQKNISMDVVTPTTVYPGQTANVQISVMDKKGKPVVDADITAYALTSKFKDYRMPNITIHGKSRYAKMFDDVSYEIDNNSFYNLTSSLTWKRWANEMALDTVEYYKFLYPDTYYITHQESALGKTQIAPFVVVDGEVQGVNMLWIDNRLYYTNQSDNYDTYSFEVDSGKHNLRFRTFDREIMVMNFYVKEGKKNIVSFDAGKPYVKIPNEDLTVTPFVLTSRLLDKKYRGYLTDIEAAELNSQLITVDNNFGEIELPNIRNRIDIPAYIKTGNVLYYLNQTSQTSYDPVLGARVKSPILVGPFPRRYNAVGFLNRASVYAGDQLLVNTEIEGRNLYTLYPNYQKIKQWAQYPISRDVSSFRPSLNFRQQVLLKEDIDKDMKRKIEDAMRSSDALIYIKPIKKKYSESDYKLKLNLGRDTTGIMLGPLLVLVEPKREEDRHKFQLYYGKVRSFEHLPTEELTLHFIFNDSTSYSYPARLHKGGMNYLNLDSIAHFDKNAEVAKIAFNLFEKGIKTHRTPNPFINKPATDSISYSPIFNEDKFSKENSAKGLISGVVRDGTDVVIGAFVRVKGTDNGTITDYDGRFELNVGGNATLEASLVGYNTQEIKVSTGHYYTIVLHESELRLDEVVVTAYGIQKKQNLTGSVTTINEISLGVSMDQVLQGRVAGISIRGVGSVNENTQPLIIVNGLPFNGSLESIDVASILSMNVLKDASATALYGSQAANGVIMIETNALSAAKTLESANDINDGGGNTMRRNFHDDAFWQPRLKTDERGVANFEVTYPDDITNWNAYFIALGGKNQSDTKQLNIRSFKALSARLSAPSFAIRGDSLNAVGRVTNHFGDSLVLTKTIDWDNHKQSEKIEIGNSYVNYIPVNVDKGDSLTIAYSLQMENGYFDGEERSIPIFEQGLLQAHGDFCIMNDSSTYTFNADRTLGEVTLHAEASSLELFMREIESIDNYAYNCNEQMASKIKALLSKKYICKIKGEAFKDDSKINQLIKELNKNKNKEGLWGWWNKSTTEMWISKHVLNVLLDAEDAGYKTELDSYALASKFEQDINLSLPKIPLIVDKKSPNLRAKGELLDRLIFLQRLNAPVDYKAILSEIDSLLEDKSINDKLKSMLILSSALLNEPINMDSLMHYSNKTILGSLYWGENKTSQVRPLSFRPYETNVDNTLIAYQILKNVGKHEKDLEQIRNYFFEQRQNNAWNNIYEASRIVQAIMPEMMAVGVDEYANAVITVNGRKITKFPYTSKFAPKRNVAITKTGTLPLFVTTYQQGWNKNPMVEKAKGIEISTVFVLNNDSVANMREGKATTLRATLDLHGEAEYVQIEIPIPAGCSYESKPNGYFRGESHREYYKDKVVIFCAKLSKGKHVFDIQLLPRYTGRYTLNPAKAELMYFPAFYGNNVIKTTLIE